MKRSDKVHGIRVSLVRDAAPIPNYTGATTLDAPARAAELFRALIPTGDEREHFCAAYVDARSNVKGVAVISIGTLSASLVHPREVFRPAIVAGAAAIIVCHNHPSGDTTPSAEDKDATRRLSRAGELLGVPLLDHVIIGDGAQFFSFKDRGLL
jgi:DNA repair protein RadC